MELIYFDTKRAVRVHDAIIEMSGGRPGILDEGKVESILIHIQNDDYYPGFEDKLTHLVHSINKAHCFIDANKRSSIALGSFFLMVNGLDTFVDKFIIEMENIAVAVADDLIDKELLKGIITSLINDEYYPETLKLEIIHALSRVDPESSEISLGSEFYKDLF